MNEPVAPIILGVDENREVQKAVSQIFNAQQVMYRFVSDRQRVSAAVRQLQPHLILLFGELASDFVIQVLDALAADVVSAQRPVVLVSQDTSDAPFLQGMRSGVVGMLKAPFAGPHLGVVRALWDELGTRSGTSSGTASPSTVQHFIEHIRRTRRSGLLTTDERTANEGKASFVYGRLDRASFLGAQGPHALAAMLSQPTIRWSFTEVAGSRGEGAGVVIEVGELETGETAVAEVVVGQLDEDEPLTFEVPVLAARPGAPSANVPAEGAPAATQLLLVDDDPTIIKMFSTLFTKHGFAVTTATDGQEGFQAALSHDFDAVLADLNMPHLDGWGLLRRLREDFRTRELPIAFLSAHEDYRESLRALDSGAQAYLSKGTKLDVIIGQVVKLIDPRRTLEALLELGQAEALAIHTVGPQWLINMLSRHRSTGMLTCRDGWASYQLAFSAGTCIHASAVAGKYKAEGERALNAFIASRSAEGQFHQGNLPALGQNLFLATEVLVERACSVLNDNEQKMRESLMVSATEVQVNDELYAVYRAVGPRQWLEAARLICEEKKTARDVIAILDASPVEIEECMKDLIRRGVITLR
jgi:CheY-like chemotaxis protein